MGGSRLIANRFFRSRSGAAAVDLATGEHVELCARRRVAPARHREWLECAATLASVWHPHVLSPLDFGTLPDGRRFEARALTTPLTAGRLETASAFRAAISFLTELGLYVPRCDPSLVRSHGSRAVLPVSAATCRRACTGLPTSGRGRSDRSRAAFGGDAIGLRLQPRSALGWLTDLIDGATSGGPRLVRLVAPPGSGLRTLLRCLARDARLRGYVPLDARVARHHPAILGAIAGQHVLLIDLQRGQSGTSTRDGVGSRVILRLAIASPRGHVWLTAGDLGSADATAIDPLTSEQLLRMLVGRPPCSRTRALQLASCAGGNPGTFLALLRSDRVRSPHHRSSALALVRESAREYRSRSPVAALPVTCKSATDVDSRATPGTGEVVSGQRRAWRLVRLGRHAAAFRAMQALRAARARRGDSGGAAACDLTMGQMARARGRVDEASTCFERAGQSMDENVALHAAIGLAHARTDQGRLVEAEAVARAARAVAARDQFPREEHRARLALARILRWQARYGEAVHLLGAPASEDVAIEAERLGTLAEVELLRARLPAATAAAAAAVDVAHQVGSASVLAAAHAVMASVCAVLGNPAQVGRHVKEGRRAAQASRSPLTGYRLSLSAAEGWVLAGNVDACRAAAAALARRRLPLPPLDRARVEGVRAAGGDTDAARAVRRWTAATGLVIRVARLEAGDMDVMEDVTAILRACQEAADSPAALAAVCREVRQRLRARAVAIVGRCENVETPLAAIGPSWNLVGSVRSSALESGLALPPTLSSAGLECAAPVRYVGRTIGALGCRWSVGESIEGSRMLPFLTMAASICAPAVQAVLDERLAERAARVSSTSSVPALLGVSRGIDEVRDLVRRAARAPFAVLVQGESGSGKELVARAIHEAGPQRGHRFCAVNCAALGDELLEAELFGHTRGAFTGAVQERAGLFEEANQGTLFLDEVSELSPRAQAKLLRVIQEGEIRRLGENLPRRVEVRLVAATNRPLDEEVGAGRFRADLRYRLDVIRVTIPPLRDRPEDLPLLIAHFWRQASSRAACRATLAPDVLEALARYEWPGNVRELQNVLAALAVQSGGRGRVRADALPLHLAPGRTSSSDGSLNQARLGFERQFVRAALARAGGHRGRAARDLGMSRQGLAKLIKRLELDPGPLLENAEVSRARKA